MNKTQIQGLAKNIFGIVQVGVGQFLGNKELHTSGLQKHSAGKAKMALGDAREIIKYAVKEKCNQNKKALIIPLQPTSHR